MRLNQPIPILMILYPTLWVLFYKDLPSLKTIIIFCLGSILMRTIGCIFNDINDYYFDSQVKRTSHRPIANGNISRKKALYLVIFLLFLAVFLIIQLNYLTICIGILSFICTLIYPIFKRFFLLPQLFLGITINLGIIMAYTSMYNHFPSNSIWILYFSSIFWTLSYDTIYALSDQHDDIKLNLKSSTITFGKQVFVAIMLFQFVMIVGFKVFALMNHYSQIFNIFLLIIIIILIYQNILCKKIYNNNIYNFTKIFLNNQWIGLIIFLAIIIK